MNENQFWHSTDGQILTVKNKDGDMVDLAHQKMAHAILERAARIVEYAGGQ